MGRGYPDSGRDLQRVLEKETCRTCRTCSLDRENPAHRRVHWVQEEFVTFSLLTRRQRDGVVRQALRLLLIVHRVVRRCLVPTRVCPTSPLIAPQFMTIRFLNTPLLSGKRKNQQWLGLCWSLYQRQTSHQAILKSWRKMSGTKLIKPGSALKYWLIEGQHWFWQWLTFFGYWV